MKRELELENECQDIIKQPKLEQPDDFDDVPTDPASFHADSGLAPPPNCDRNGNVPAKVPVPPVNNSPPTRKNLLVAEWGCQYKIRRTMGSGVYGNVFKVIDAKKGDAFAMKVLKICFQDSKEFFNSETAVMKHVSTARHRNLVNLVQSGELTKSAHNCSTLAILMDLCGPSIYTVMSDVKHNSPEGYVTFPIPDIKRISCQIVDGMKQLEKMKVFHLDLKPENIFFSLNSNKLKTTAKEFGTMIHMDDLQIRIGDFGCSKFYEDHSETKKPTTVQTQNYRAPEIMMGLPHTKKTDVWSVGCILYEMYTGELMFYGNLHNDTEFVQFAMMQRVLCHHPSPRMWKEALKIRSPKVEISNGDVPVLKGRIINGYPKVTPLFQHIRRGDFAAVDLFYFLDYILKIDPECRPTFDDLSVHGFFDGHH